jgi:predicted ATP-dependent endonuclease of OLD family
MLLFSYFNNVKDLFNLIAVEEPESHLSTDNLNLIMSFIDESLKANNSLTQFIITTHRPEVINKLRLDNVVIVNENKAISLKDADVNLVNYLSKRPNLDILKILFSKKLCLVEGVTEEMYINTILENEENSLFDIDVISIGQRGFRMFMDVWLEVNKDTNNKLLVVRDYDNLEKAKKDHDKYEEENDNIKVSTTKNYTFEDDFSQESNNAKILSKKLGIIENEVAEKLKDDKAQNMLDICQMISKKELQLTVPEYIKGNLEWLKK